MSAMLQAGGERLGSNAPLSRSALAEIQQVFVRAASAASGPTAVTDADAPEASEA